MKLFRVENRDTRAGLWYSGVTAQLSGVAAQINLSGKDLPMGFDESIAQEKWISAADSIETLKFWFTFEDLNKLIVRGYRLYEVNSDKVKIHSTPFYTHHLFQEDGAQYVETDIGILLPK